MTNSLDVHCTYTFTFVCVQCINLYIYMYIYFRLIKIQMYNVHLENRQGRGGEGCGGGILS